MQVEISKKVDVKETIDIELPYYYKHDLMLDCCSSVIYGKIGESLCTSIQISSTNEKDEYELDTEVSSLKEHSCYFEDKYKSSEAEYLAAKSKMLAAVQKA